MALTNFYIKWRSKPRFANNQIQLCIRKAKRLNKTEINDESRDGDNNALAESVCMCVKGTKNRGMDAKCDQM